MKYQEIINRLKKSCGILTDIDLAKLLGLNGDYWLSRPFRTDREGQKKSVLIIAIAFNRSKRGALVVCRQC